MKPNPKIPPQPVAATGEKDEKPKANKPGVLKLSHVPKVKITGPGAKVGGVVALLLAMMLSVFAQPGIITQPGTQASVFTNRLLTTLQASGVTNRLTFTNASAAFGATNSTHIKSNSTAGRWEWLTNYTSVVATNVNNRPTGNWTRVLAGAATYGQTRYEPRSPQTLPDAPSSTAANPVFVQVNSNGVVTSPTNFWEANAGSIEASGVDAPTVAAIMETNNAATAASATNLYPSAPLSVNFLGGTLTSGNATLGASGVAVAGGGALTPSGFIGQGVGMTNVSGVATGATNAAGAVLATIPDVSSVAASNTIYQMTNGANNLSAGTLTANNFAGNGAGLTNLFGVSTNVFYVSQNGGIATTNREGLAPDSGPALQWIYDQETNHPSGIEVVYDGVFNTAQTLKVGSKTTHTGLTPDCGIMLSNACNQWMMICRNQNGNVFTSSNMVFRNLKFYGVGESQNRYITNTSPFYEGDWRPLNSRTPTDPVTDPNNGFPPWMLGVWLSGVDGLVIENVKFDNMRTFALTLSKVKNFRVQNIVGHWDDTVATGNEDTIHLWPPLAHGVVRDVVGNGDDDVIGLITDELTYVTNVNMSVWRGTNGGVDNVVIENIYKTEAAGGIVRVIAFNQSLGNNGVTNLTLRNIKGQHGATSVIRGPITSTWSGVNVWADGLTIEDVSSDILGAGGVDLHGINGTKLTIRGVKSYGSPSYWVREWSTDRLTPAYISLSRNWGVVDISDVHCFAPAGTTNAALVSTHYSFSTAQNPMISIANSSISGTGIRAVVANHGNIGTLSFSGVSSTNTLPIPGAYTAKTVSGGGTINLAQTFGVTNYAEDTTLYLRKVRQLGYEPTPSRLRAIDWGLQYLANSGDLANMQEVGFLAGATNINEVLPKIRTYYTNEWNTNAFQINLGFTSASLSRFGLTGNGVGYLDTQIAINTTNIGFARYTNFSAGVYLHTLATTNAATAFAGGSWPATGNADRFSFDAWSPSSVSTPEITLGNTLGPNNLFTNVGLHSISTTNASLCQLWLGGDLVGSSAWNGQGFQAGTFWVMKGQYFPLSTNQVISFWYVGNSSVNRSNVSYAARIMTEMAACYSPAPVYSTGWTNYFAGPANVLIKGGANVGVTNQLGQTVADLATATNVTFTLKPGWIIGGTGLTGVATDLN